MPDLVAKLQSVDLPQVFNPYRDICSEADDQLSPQIRTANLRAYVNYLQTHSPSHLWLGEALGYKGGRRTGLPFSDDTQLDNYLRLGDGYRAATITSASPERTAKAIWQMIDQLEQPPGLWNAFPFHPYQDLPLTNRKPKISELEATSHLLKEFIEICGHPILLAIGRTAETWLQRMGYKVTYIRHPSYGGLANFRQGIISAYQ